MAATAQSAERADLPTVFGSLWDVETAAAYLGVTPRGIRTLYLDKGVLPYYRIGRWVRFAKADLDAYLAGRRVEADGAA